jgi:hypothetical protein
MLSEAKHRQPNDRKIQRLLCATLLLAYGYFFFIGGNDNVTIRLAMVHAIVEEGRLEVDHFISPNLIDKAEFNGHFYCDKAIGASLLAVPVAWLTRTVATALGVQPEFVETPQGLRRIDMRRLYVTYCATLLVIAVPTVFACLLLYRLLTDFDPDTTNRLWTTLSYGLGTFAWIYSTWFFGHQLAAAMAFIAFYVIYKMRRDGVRPAWLFLSGLAAGYSFLSDYPCAVVVAVLGLYAFYSVQCSMSNVQSESRSLVIGHWSLVIRRWSFYAIGALLPVIVLMWYNWACFGNPLDTGYKHESNPYFREQMARGLMGIHLPKLDALYGITLSPRRGLFFSCPFLLFGFAGWVALWRRGFRAESLVCAVIVGTFFFINASYYLWWGGTVYGPRFLVPCLPFLAFPVIFALRLWSLPVKLLMVVSMLIQCVVVLTSPNMAENLQNPLIEESLTRLALGQSNATLLAFVGIENSVSWLPFLTGMLLCFALLYRAAKDSFKF